MLKTITKTYEHIVYEYDPTEFMPIYTDGEWSNKHAFIEYKAHNAQIKAGEMAVSAVHNAIRIGNAIIEQMQKQA